MMNYQEQLFALRHYVHDVGGPETTLDMLEFLQANRDKLPQKYREMFDSVMEGFGRILG